MAIGESHPMLDALARVTGTVDYMVNLKLPGMLVAKVVRSQVPHAKLLRVDAIKAMSVPGAAAILTGADLGPDSYYGAAIKDQGVVAMDRVRYVGEPVAVIAAADADAAEEAALLLNIEYEELPAVFDAQEAIRVGAPVLHERYPDNIFIHSKLRHGDLGAAFARADVVFEDTFTSPLAQQASLEPHAAAAQWNGDRLTVWTASQAPLMVRRVLAEIFGLPQDAVRVIVPPLGGAYGGKGHIRIEPLVAALAREADGRPVKLVLSRAEEFVTVTKHAASITLKTGVCRDRTFAARQATIHWNAGAYADASPLLIPQGMVRAIGPYRIPVVHVDSYGIYTNLPPAGAYRGAMSSQTTWAYESQMDIIARRMGWDPLEFRLKNLFVSGDEFATGETLHDVHFVECLQASAQAMAVPPASSQTSLHDRPGFKVGRGYGVMMKSTVSTSKSVARLRLDRDGVLTLFTSTVEMGQGAHTALAQIAADATGVALANVRVVGPDTAVTPFDSTTSASRSTGMMGQAVLSAGAALKRRLLELAAPLLESSMDRLRPADGEVLAPDNVLSYADILRRNALPFVEETAEHATAFKLDPETGQGISTPHWHQGAGAAEVQVELATGKVTVLRYAAASFAGRVVNPHLARLQNDGNVIFGLGPTLMEALALDGGQITNPNLADYPIPSIRDIPRELITACIESGEGEFHGIGEITLPPVAPAVANAIEAAIGVRIKDLPITAEKVLRALQEKSSP